MSQETTLELIEKYKTEFPELFPASISHKNQAALAKLIDSERTEATEVNAVPYAERYQFHPQIKAAHDAADKRVTEALKGHTVPGMSFLRTLLEQSYGGHVSQFGQFQNYDMSMDPKLDAPYKKFGEDGVRYKAVELAGNSVGTEIVRRTDRFIRSDYKPFSSLVGRIGNFIAVQTQTAELTGKGVDKGGTGVAI